MEIISGNLRMTGDRILLKPLEWSGEEVHGAETRIAIVRHGRALRGVVRAVGPGIHPVSKRVAIEGGKKQRVEFSRHFRRTEVRIGDIVELGGLNIFGGNGYDFPEVMVNGEKCLIVTERDVAGVLTPDSPEATVISRRLQAGSQAHGVFEVDEAAQPRSSLAAADGKPSIPINNWL